MDETPGKVENEIKLSPDSELRFEVESNDETVYLEVYFKNLIYFIFIAIYCINTFFL